MDKKTIKDIFNDFFVNLFCSFNILESTTYVSDDPYDCF
jgi:hypothetical protein